MVLQLVFLSNALFGIGLQWLVFLLEPSPRDKSPWQFHYVWVAGSIQMPNVPWSHGCLVYPDCGQQLPAAGRWRSLISQCFTVVQREQPWLSSSYCWFSYCLWLEWGDAGLANNFPVLILRLFILLFLDSGRRLLSGELEGPHRLPEWGDDPSHTS